MVEAAMKFVPVFHPVQCSRAVKGRPRMAPKSHVVLWADIMTEKVMEPMQSKGIIKVNKIRSQCKVSLIDLQQRKQGHCTTSNHQYSWGKMYGFALRKAVYAHDWDELLCLLRAAPVWEHNRKRQGYGDYYYSYFDNYFKAFTILLMNHPDAKSQNLLHDYLHMVQSCRSDEDKRALTKLLVALPDKLVSRNSHSYQTDWLVSLYERSGESY